ncbi:MAG: hypothetical protein QOF76_1730 [Solirubrobacteraceae bacterium]|jgi:hypothetical protein|nr:hypothetical protein [Solirubrobacteraceae bacterium]
MTALAFDFNYEDGVDPAPKPQRRLYAVRGTVDDAVDASLIAALPGPATAAGGAPAAPFSARRRAPKTFSSGAAPRLDVLIGGAWEALTGGTSSACPMCAGTLVPRLTAAAGRGAAGGRCSDCGTTIE